MINLRETRQQLDRLSQKALGLLTFALQVPLIPVMGCGYVKFEGSDHDLHDYGETMMVKESYSSLVPYDQERHGEIFDFVEEGERLPNHPNNKDGKVPIHRHDGTNSAGPHNFNYE